MGNLLQFAKITSIVAGVVISLFFANLLTHFLKHRFLSLPQYSWIASQLIIFIIFKLSTAHTNDVKSDATDHSPPAATTAAAESDKLESSSSTDRPSYETLSADIDMVVEGREGGPGRLRKSNTWEGHCRKVAEAEAEAAGALRRLKSSETFKKKVANLEVEVEEVGDDAGLRRREELMVGKDELLQRVETFIKKHYEQLRLQQQQEISQRRRSMLESIHKPF